MAASAPTVWPPSGASWRSVASTIPRTFHVGEISRESGYALAKKAVEEHTLAEAVLLGSDEVAEGALEAFRELGVRVPKDVAVIIYQDIQTLESKWPTGTCLEMFRTYVWKRPGTAFWPDQSASFPGSDRHGAHSPEDWRHGLNYPSGYQRAFLYNR